MAEEKPAKKSKGGKPKGAISKRTLDLMSEFEAQHFNVVLEAIDTYKAARAGAAEFKDLYKDILEKLDKLDVGANGRVTINIRDPRADFLKVAENAVSNLMQYVYPKRKAVELTGADGQALALSFTELMRQAATDDSKPK